jgi:hypothetical protein
VQQPFANFSRLWCELSRSLGVGNTQPWRFEIREDSIAVVVDAMRHIGSFDPFRRKMHQSLGCALENLALAATAQGLVAEIELQPGRLELRRS